ncbi:MAG: RNA methyltransferase [Acidimicrobiia bacterium]
MGSPEITSPSNARIKRLAGLRERRSRDRERVLVAEGQRLFERAIAAGYECLELYYVPGRFDPPPEIAAETVTVSEEALARASYRSRSQGVLGVFRQPANRIEALGVHGDSLFLVLEGLAKPGNLGAILRTADAVGAAGVMVADPGTDLFNPNVIRASTGAMFSMTCVTGSLIELIDWLRSHSVTIVGLDGSAPTSLWDTALSSPLALLVGSEDEGLTPEARSLCDRSMSIPMVGASDSLNASVAVAVAAFEVIRRSRSRGATDHR